MPSSDFLKIYIIVLLFCLFFMQKILRNFWFDSDMIARFLWFMKENVEEAPSIGS